VSRPSFAVYLLIGDDDEPIYIGQSACVKSRLRDHQRDTTVHAALGGRTKHQATRRVAILACGDRSDMNATEKRLIAEHRPVLNKYGNPDSDADGRRRAQAAALVYRSPRLRLRASAAARSAAEAPV
jgi:hypothetical protein